MAFGQKSIIIGLFSLSHEQNKARFNYAMARKQRRMPIYTEFIRMFWGLPTARNLWRKSLMKYGLRPEINHHRNLYGIYTDIFGVASQEIFGGNLF